MYPIFKFIICVVLVLCVLGNKSDLKADREISQQQALDYAYSIGAGYYETSAMTREGVWEDGMPCFHFISLSATVVNCLSVMNLSRSMQPVAGIQEVFVHCAKSLISMHEQDSGSGLRVMDSYSNQQVDSGSFSLHRSGTDSSIGQQTTEPQKKGWCCSSS